MFGAPRSGRGPQLWSIVEMQSIGIGLAANADGAIEMAGLVEMSVIGRSPGEFAARFGRGLQRLGLHRVHVGIVNVERRHDRPVVTSIDVPAPSS